MPCKKIYFHERKQRNNEYPLFGSFNLHVKGKAAIISIAIVEEHIFVLDYCILLALSDFIEKQN